jgi:hypothetical protein
MKDAGRNVVCTLVVFLFGMALALFILRPLKLDSEVTTLINIMIGALSAEFSGVVRYYIGSSRSSSDKDEMIKNVVEQKGSP